MNNYYRLVLLLTLALQCPAGIAEFYEYRLGPGDEIQIQVYDENDLSMRLRVDESGAFNYPYIGTVTANGRTVVELENRLIAGLLEDVLVKPNVNVSITSYRNFYIGGEVKKPGGTTHSGSGMPDASRHQVQPILPEPRKAVKPR